MNINKVQQLIELIANKNTGTPLEIASKLCVSERQLFNYLEILKTEFKAPIAYSRSNKTYFFTEKGKIELKWQEEDRKTDV